MSGVAIELKEIYKIYGSGENAFEAIKGVSLAAAVLSVW